MCLTCICVSGTATLLPPRLYLHPRRHAARGHNRCGKRALELPEEPYQKSSITEFVLSCALVRQKSPATAKGALARLKEPYKDRDPRNPAAGLEHYLEPDMLLR